MGLGVLFGRIYASLLRRVLVGASRVRRFFRRTNYADDITAVIITCQESTYDECLEAVENQTFPVTVKTVRDMHPLSASLDAALDACETKWLLMVDADTILQPCCVELMSNYLGPNVGMVVAKLFDKIYGVIGFLRLVDADALKSAKFRHPPDTPYPDRAARDYLLSIGMKRTVVNATVGEHNPYATSFEAFRRFYGTYRKRSDEEHHMGAHLAFILKYACRNREWNEVYYMLAGLVCSAIVDSDVERDYVADGEMSQLFRAVSSKDKNVGRGST